MDLLPLLKAEIDTLEQLIHTFVWLKKIPPISQKIIRACICEHTQRLWDLDYE